MIEVGQLRFWKGVLDPDAVGYTFTILRRMDEFPTQDTALWEVFHHDRGVSTGWSTEFLLTYSDLLEPVQQAGDHGITG